MIFAPSSQLRRFVQNSSYNIRTVAYSYYVSNNSQPDTITISLGLSSCVEDTVVCVSVTDVCDMRNYQKHA